MTGATLVIDYVLEKSSQEPAARRAKLYRSLAALTLEESRAKALTALAIECDEIDQKCRQLRMDLGEDKVPSA